MKKSKFGWKNFILTWKFFWIFFVVVALDLCQTLDLGYNVIEQTGKFCPGRGKKNVFTKGFYFLIQISIVYVIIKDFKFQFSNDLLARVITINFNIFDQETTVIFVPSILTLFYRFLTESSLIQEISDTTYYFEEDRIICLENFQLHFESKEQFILGLIFI